MAVVGYLVALVARIEGPRHEFRGVYRGHLALVGLARRHGVFARHAFIGSAAAGI